ncbi:MAG: hypothetical protein H6622_05400 [Halobacteriovoraceae bacterium]|nr:hypothetical protein [Halobacteriovoraceae bacterium]
MFKKKELIEYIQKVKEELDHLKKSFANDPIKLYEHFWQTRRGHEKKLNSADEWNDTNNERWDFINPFNDELEILEEEIIQLAPVVAIKDKSKTDDLRNFLYHQHLKRFDLIGKIGDDKSFEIIKKATIEEFTKKYYDASPYIVQGLIEIGRIEKYHAGVVDLFKKSFDEFYLNAIKDGELINSVSMQSFAFGCANLGEIELIDSLLKAYNYCSSEYSHYEINKVTGPIALALCFLGYNGKVKFISKFLGKYEELYEGSDFVMDNLYALWLLKKDEDSAFEYFQDHEQGLGKSLCALADLNAKTYLQEIKNRISSVTDPIILEVFKEAIKRLETQTELPLPSERMIWLYGKKSTTELVLGSETDNEFVRRARKNSNNNNIFEITETDEDIDS